MADAAVRAAVLAEYRPSPLVPVLRSAQSAAGVAEVPLLTSVSNDSVTATSVGARLMQDCACALPMPDNSSRPSAARRRTVVIAGSTRRRRGAAPRE
jgi:hypothetical protein